MKVSLNIVKQFIDFELPPVDELVGRINAQLGAVEEVIDLATKYKDATIVKVVECEKHPNADKLSVCTIDVGGDPLYSKFYNPNSNLVQIVCGANNVHAGMWAVWLPPESTVPATYDDAEPFVLGSRELRGVMSNGMLASARELGIGDDHDGIVEITEGDLCQGSTLILEAGVSFAEVFGLDDTIIDIENKMFTHRPDLFGQLGVAREIAGIFGKQFTSPEWYRVAENGIGNLEHRGQKPADGDGIALEVFNDAPDKSPRLMAVAIKDVEVRPSPLWLRCQLVAMGGKPINNIVDVTNYIMLVTAQPVHAYDYDKLRGHRLGVRMAMDGEKLPLLNGKTYELASDDIVIADGEGAIGLAGIMGGGNSEVSSDTKKVVLEVANFDMYALRRSSMRHGLFTDALTRFNKGQSPLQNPAVMAKLIQLIGGKQASQVFDAGIVVPAEENDEPVSQEVRVTDGFINKRLGLKLSQGDIQKLLENVEIGVNSPGDHDKYFEVLPPFWRTDLSLPEDAVEEVGRLYGFDKLPRELPQRSTKPAPANLELRLMQTIRDGLAQAGANEVLTYSFVPERVIKSANQDAADAYRLSNALSPDLQYYRLSLTPSLLDKVHANIKAGHEEFALFEIGKSHSKAAGLDSEGLPVEPGRIALVYASNGTQFGAPYYQAKTLLEFLADKLGLELSYEPLGAESTDSVAMPFEPRRSAVVTDKQSGLYLGIVGEYKNSVSRSFKLPEYSAGFELSIASLLELSQKAPLTYRSLSRFPSVERDISLRVASDTSYVRVLDELEKACGATQLNVRVEPVSIYQPEAESSITFTFRIRFTSHDRTLVSSEVNEVINSVASQFSSVIAAEVV